MAYFWSNMGESDGTCGRCDREDVALMDGQFCQQCLSEMWADSVSDVLLFGLYRHDDESGVSGEGLVALGAHFPRPNGRVVLAWMTEVNSVAVYDTLDDVQDIHGHEGSTSIVYF